MTNRETQKSYIIIGLCGIPIVILGLIAVGIYWFNKLTKGIIAWYRKRTRR